MGRLPGRYVPAEPVFRFVRRMVDAFGVAHTARLTGLRSSTVQSVLHRGGRGTVNEHVARAILLAYRDSGLNTERSAHVILQTRSCAFHGCQQEAPAGLFCDDHKEEAQ